MTETIVEIIKSRLLTPIIYLIDDEVLSVIGFFDGSTKINYIYETQSMIEKAIGREINICDIRDFPEADRVDIRHNAILAYSETPMIKAIFEAAMVEDFNIAESKRKTIIDRSNEDGTVYFS